MIPSIENLTKEEKLQLMEAIWEDFTRTAEEYQSPDWHKAELAEREKDIADGKAKIMGLEEAKIEIQRLINEG